jgi:phosphopantetheine adenylyltransferase
MKTYLGDLFDQVAVNVFDKESKKIVFTGSQRDTAVYIGASAQNITGALKYKRIIKKKYVVIYCSIVSIF